MSVGESVADGLVSLFCGSPAVLHEELCYCEDICCGFVGALCRFSPCSNPSPRSTWAGPRSPCWRASGPGPWHRIRGHRASGLCGRTTALPTWTKACRRRWEPSSLLLPGQLLLQVSARRLSSRAADRKTASISHGAGGDPARLRSEQTCRTPATLAPLPFRRSAGPHRRRAA